MISEDEAFEYYRGYKVPKHYSIPPDYTLPEAMASEQKTATKPQKAEKKWEIDPLTIALITTGMVALFGGVMAGRKSKEVKKTKW